MNVAPRVTPMLQQYFEAKARAGDALLLYRMGDFFELFFEDAEKASALLGLTLTSRHRDSDIEAPMCGMPHHAVEGYIAQLVAAGHRVAVCDQVEDAKKAKGLVRREITRIVTPGTVLEPESLPTALPNYLRRGLPPRRSRGGRVPGPVDRRPLGGRSLRRRAPRRDDRLSRAGSAACRKGNRSTEFRSWRPRVPRRRSPRRAPSAGSRSSSGERRSRVSASRPGTPGSRPAGRRSSTRARTGGARRSTSRRLGRWRRTGTFVSTPRRSRTSRSSSRRSPVERDAVLRPRRHLHADGRARPARGACPAPAGRAGDRGTAGRDRGAAGPGRARREIRERLRGVGDLARRVGRIALKAAGPRDVAGLGATLEGMPALRDALGPLSAGLLAALRGRFPETGDLALRIRETLADEPPALVSAGGAIRADADPELAELPRAPEQRAGGARAVRAAREGAHRHLEPSGPVQPGLRLFDRDHARPEGQDAGRLRPPPDARQRRAVTTRRAQELEAKILGADERMLEIETPRVRRARREPRRRGDPPRGGRPGDRRDRPLRGAGRGRRGARVRPAGSPPSRVIRIVDGRHPVVERVRRDEPFVPNDTDLDARDAQIVILTGPEHGRQVDLPAPGGADRADGAARQLRPGAGGARSAPSTASSPASAPATTWRAASRPSWSR